MNFPLELNSLQESFVLKLELLPRNAKGLQVKFPIFGGGRGERSSSFFILLFPLPSKIKQGKKINVSCGCFTCRMDQKRFLYSYGSRLFQGKYTTKSDVWSFAVTLWEILTLARETPYQELADAEVMQNLSHLHHENGLFVFLPRPPCTKDIFDLMLECWRKHETERPTFREIHLFLQRKNLGYAPVL